MSNERVLLYEDQPNKSENSEIILLILILVIVVAGLVFYNLKQKGNE